VYLFDQGELTDERAEGAEESEDQHLSPFRLPLRSIREVAVSEGTEEITHRKESPSLL
jgi:hypothetical protein